MAESSGILIIVLYQILCPIFLFLLAIGLDLVWRRVARCLEAIWNMFINILLVIWLETVFLCLLFYVTTNN